MGPPGLPMATTLHSMPLSEIVSPADRKAQLKLSLYIVVAKVGLGKKNNDSKLRKYLSIALKKEYDYTYFILDSFRC